MGWKGGDLLLGQVAGSAEHLRGVADQWNEDKDETGVRTYDDGVISECVATGFHGRDCPGADTLRLWRHYGKKEDVVCGGGKWASFIGDEV